MSKQSIALAYSRPPDALGEPEYHALAQALSETARGRAFLDEHARRSRSAETKILLTAIERIEAQVRPRPRDPVYDDLGRVIEELRAARERIEAGGKVAKADQLGALLELLLRRISKMLPPPAADVKRIAPPSKPAPAPAPAQRSAPARWLEEPLVPPPAVNDARPLPRPAGSGIAAKVASTLRTPPPPRVDYLAQPRVRPATAVEIEAEIKDLVDTKVGSRSRAFPGEARTSSPSGSATRQTPRHGQGFTEAVNVPEQAPPAAAAAPTIDRAITAKEALAAIMALSEEERIALFS